VKVVSRGTAAGSEILIRKDSRDAAAGNATKLLAWVEGLPSAMCRKLRRLVYTSAV
jgi:hypothetical protein